LLQSLASELGKQVRFNLEARTAYLKFALSKEALWTGNFRDLGASITRLATLAEGGRITTEDVKAEILRLQWIWADAGGQASSSTEISDTELTALLAGQSLDPFDAVQLKSVIQVCRQSNSLSDAGRQLFAVSRLQRSVVNDADRLRKYLARFDLTWEVIQKHGTITSL
jgi:transcriptional regulatory protein RtcR